MRAAIYQSAGEVVVEDVPDAALREPTDAVVRVVRSCICGSDLWAYRGIINRAAGSRLGH
jgi:threonine dehydrogenase-like Zn-dependent dehydrogenase